MSATAVIDSLGQLTPEQLREVQARATYLLDPTAEAVTGSHRRAEKPLDKDVVQTWDVMRECLSKYGESVGRPLKMILRDRRIGPALRDTSKVLADLLRDFHAERDAERVKVLRLVIGLSAADLHRRGVLTVLRLVQRLRYADRTVERHFPNYRAAGLLPIILSKVSGSKG